MSTPVDIPFQQLLGALLDIDTPLNPLYLYRLSDLEEPELGKLKAIWPQVPPWRRQALMEDVEELSGRDTLLSFLSLGRFATQDENARVRLLAVRTLWEYEERELIPTFLQMLEGDEDAEVRAAAVGALGQYVFLGELEKIPSATRKRVEDTLIGVVNGEDEPQVRRSALESLGFSGREEVSPMIEAAYHSKEKEWIASALFAMGRSADREWAPKILDKLHSTFPILRSEAARATGELEIPEAVPDLIELLDDPDENTRLASIWSLSQIGGEGVRETLERMYSQAEEEGEISLLELALDNLMFNEGLQFMPFFDLPEYEEDDLDETLNHYDDNKDPP